MDESKFIHRKYHRGAYHEGHWVLGMVERESNLCMMVAVESWGADVLLPIIAQHVLPRTRTSTDGWAAYNQLSQHKAVNHQLHFVDPNDCTLHTNTVEGSWGREDQAMHGTNEFIQLAPSRVPLGTGVSGPCLRTHTFLNTSLPPSVAC